VAVSGVDDAPVERADDEPVPVRRASRITLAGDRCRATVRPSSGSSTRTSPWSSPVANAVPAGFHAPWM
jgi:hypothetical protein